eukprot:scaffold2079_cov173-Ochromonas_danica.AAC.2
MDDSREDEPEVGEVEDAILAVLRRREVEHFEDEADRETQAREDDRPVRPFHLRHIKSMNSRHDPRQPLSSSVGIEISL